MKVSESSSQKEWDQLVSKSGGHPLQLWGWGGLKAAHGWQAHRLIVSNDEGQVVGGAQVLRRRLPKPFGAMLYIPRGPVGEGEVVLPAITDYCRKHFKASHITVEPPDQQKITIKGWRRVPKAILLSSTIYIDLTREENELLAAMTKKTRQYIRKSQKDGITTRLARDEDIDACLAIYKDTASRAGFSLHSDDYYKDLHREMGEASVITVAELNGQICAFIWLVNTPDLAFELYGGMNQQGQDARANYALKWQTMLMFKSLGVATYDVNGLLNDGVSNFKRGFAAHETELAGSYDYQLSIWYPLWGTALPLAKKVYQFVSSLRK